MAVQTSLFDHSERRDLGSGAWVEVRSSWAEDPDALFTELSAAVQWRAERRQMYDRVLDVPRLVSFCDLTAEPAPHPAITRLRRAVVAPCTTTIRGLPSEVCLEPGEDPIPRRCAVNLDSVESVSVAVLVDRIGRLADERMRQVCAALAIAVDCPC